VARTGESWPGDEDKDEGSGQQHGEMESGPLGEAEQVTAALQPRMLRRFTQPPDRSVPGDIGNVGNVGDTDEMEVLSDAEARMLRRYMAPDPPQWLGETASSDLPTLPLPPLPDAPREMERAAPATSRPLARSGPLHRRLATTAPAPTYQRPVRFPVQGPAVPVVTPVNVARLVMAKFHIAVMAGLLPPHVLAVLYTSGAFGSVRRIWLAPALIALACGSAAWGTYHDRLERAIESRPFTRYVLAVLYTRWRAEMPAGVPVEHTYIAQLAPASGPFRHEWQRWHGALYTRLYHTTNLLMASHYDTLNPLTAAYLGVDPPPRLGPERVQAVTRAALNYAPAIRAQCQTAEDAVGAARSHYTAYLARNATVPRCVIEDRLAGDKRRFETPDALCALTDELLADVPEVGQWRAQIARRSGLWGDTAHRRGYYRSAPQRVALWLAEPASMVR